MVLIHGNKQVASAGGDLTKVSFLNGAHPRRRMDSAAVAKAFAADVANVDLSSWWGQQIPFSALVQAGVLVKNSDGSYGQGGGFTEGWDNCSDTPVGLPDVALM